MPTISLMVGNPVGANRTLRNPICAMSHCALTSVSPNSESYGGGKYGRGAHCDAEPPLPPAIWLSQQITPST